MSTFQALHIPPDAFEKGGVEVLRAAIVDKGLHVSVEQNAFDDPETWGALLADIARNVASVYANEKKADEGVVLDAIRETFIAEIGKPADAGTVSAKS